MDMPYLRPVLNPIARAAFDDQRHSRVGERQCPALTRMTWCLPLHIPAELVALGEEIPEALQRSVKR